MPGIIEKSIIGSCFNIKDPDPNAKNDVNNN
jgi:hypothetical protein